MNSAEDESTWPAVKKLRADPEFLLVLLAVALYLLAPDYLHARVVARMDDPLVVTLLGIATGGRFLLRRESLASKGKEMAALAPENAKAVAIYERPTTPAPSTAVDAPEGEMPPTDGCALQVCKDDIGDGEQV
jgi:hypothetical protein